MFGYFVGTIAKFLTGILTGSETMILSSITTCEATAMISLLYSANLLLLSIQPNLKQWWLKNSSPKMEGLVNPSHSMHAFMCKTTWSHFKVYYDWAFYTDILPICSPNTCTALRCLVYQPQCSHCIILDATYLCTGIKQWWEFMIMYLYCKCGTFCIPWLYE